MEQKTVVGNSQVPAFLYREDYLFFGLLVRHGLCAPDDLAALIRAQKERGGLSLVDMLAAEATLKPRTKADIQELLRLLATPDLRKYLPEAMPELQTLIEETRRGGSEPVVEKTLVEDAASAATERSAPPPAAFGSAAFASGISATVVGSGTISDMTRSFLTDEEMSRVETARAKGKGNLIGAVLGGHVLLDRLGSGGQGDVYLAKQVSLNRYVALKKLEIPATAAAADFVEAFRREAQTLARINHARIVKVYEIFQEGGSAFFTMEHVDGRTLRDLVADAKGPLPLEVAANIACQAASALSRTAGDDLVHRDIKPQNMMLDSNGDLKIVDFGLADVAARFTQGANFAGTPHFASPEQARAEKLTPLSDQYALGLTLYYVLTGDVPFKARTLHDMLELQIKAMPDPPSAVNTALTPAVDRIIMKMIAKNPADRFATFDEVFDAWNGVLEAETEKKATTSQLLGEGLIRISKEERADILKRSLVLGGAWTGLVVASATLEPFLRERQLGALLDRAGDFGTALLAFSLACIFYVAAARRKWLPTVMSLRAVLYTHIATAIPAVMLIMVHSGHFLRGILPGPPEARPVLSVVLTALMFVTAVSGSVGLMLFRAMRRQLQLNSLALRGQRIDAREQMTLLLGAKALSGWRLVHYPLAVVVILLTLLHILQALRFAVS